MSVQKGALVFPAVCTSCCSATTSWYLMRNDSPALCICKSFFKNHFIDSPMDLEDSRSPNFTWESFYLFISCWWESDVAWCSSEPMSVIIFPPLLQLLPLKSHTTVFSSTSSLRPGLHQFTSVFARNNILQGGVQQKTTTQTHPDLTASYRYRFWSKGPVTSSVQWTTSNMSHVGKRVVFVMGYVNSRWVLDMMETTKKL